MVSYPNMPDTYRQYIKSGIVEAEEELENDEQDVIPGRFEPKDNIPPELVEAVIAKESEFNPHAYNPGYCNQVGGHATGLGQFCINPGGDPGGSLELSDYETLTGKAVSQGDVLDPKRAIHLVAFGLGDRYSRLKAKNDNKTYNNWYDAVIGYSPITEAQAIPYKEDLYDYISQKYGEDRALSIQQNAGKDFASDDCGEIPWYDPISRAVCTAQRLKAIGDTTVNVGEDRVKDCLAKYPDTGIIQAGQRAFCMSQGGVDVVQILGIGGYASKFLIFAVAGAAVFLGMILLMKKASPTSLVMKAAT